MSSKLIFSLTLYTLSFEIIIGTTYSSIKPSLLYAEKVGKNVLVLSFKSNLYSKIWYLGLYKLFESPFKRLATVLLLYTITDV